MTALPQNQSAIPRNIAKLEASDAHKKDYSLCQICGSLKRYFNPGGRLGAGCSTVCNNKSHLARKAAERRQKIESFKAWKSTLPIVNTP